MTPTLFLAVVLSCLAGAAAAQELRPLEDGELAGVSGRDGVSIAMHLAINAAPGDPGAQIAIGMRNPDGQTDHLVLHGLRGTIDMATLDIDVATRPDGGEYIAIGLPSSLRFGNFGVDAISVQSDPQAPASNSLGRLGINGNLSLQGQLRLWAH